MADKSKNGKIITKQSLKIETVPVPLEHLGMELDPQLDKFTPEQRMNAWGVSRLCDQKRRGEKIEKSEGGIITKDPWLNSVALRNAKYSQ